MGRDWKSPEEIQNESEAFMKVVHVAAGVYYWEFLNSLDFDWAFITGKKKIHWPMIFYFGGRYCQVLCIIGLLIVVNDMSTRLDCQALFTFAQLTGQAAIGFASINLAIRAMAVWLWKCYIVIPLTILILGHWALLMQGVKIEVGLAPQGGCMIINSGNRILPATFTYTVCLDFIVFFVLAFQLIFIQGRRSQVVKLLFRDGLSYFIIVLSIPSLTFQLSNACLY